MMTSFDPYYFDTKLVKQGKRHLQPLYQELADWIFDEFSIRPLNIYYTKFEVGKHRSKLNIIFEEYESVRMFCDKTGNYDTVKQKMIADKLRHIILGVTNFNYFTRLFINMSHSSYYLDRILVVFSAFEPLARQAVIGEIPKTAIEKLKNELKSENIWEILPELTSTVYFFHTDQQIIDARRNGTTEIMERQYFNLLKQYDEFDYIKPDTYFLTFDSKENFDKVYDGNWFYYSRR